MSNRALRRLLNDKIEEATTESSEQFDNELKPQRKNLFSLVNGDNDEVGSEEFVAEQEIDSGAVKSIKTKKSIKKKTNKTKEKLVANDAELRQNDHFNDCLLVEMRNLDSTNEMKRLFGPLILSENQDTKARGRNIKHHYTRAKLVNPKSNWPLLTKSGISMEQLKLNTQSKGDENTATKILDLQSASSSDDMNFVFKHNQKYQKLQRTFCHCVAAMDQSGIIDLHGENPYHIDTLIQMSLIMRLHNDYDIAANLIEQALYVMESEFHPRFKLTDPIVRLEYKYRENRSFHIALFYHACTLNFNGCSRTALEVCKLMLRLDPSDPLGVLYIIDRLALKSRQYAFLIQFYEQYQNTYSLTDFPNMAYSIPLAFKLYQLTNCMGPTNETVAGPSNSGANKSKLTEPKNRKKNETEIIDMKDDELETRAENLLRQAVLKFPWGLYALLKRCAIDRQNFCDSISRVCPLFKPFAKNTAKMSIPVVLQKLVDHYADDTEPYWRRNMPGFFEDEYFLFDWIANVLNNGEEMGPKLQNANPEYVKTAERFKLPAPLNVCRHYMLLTQYLDSDTSSAGTSSHQSTFRVTPILPDSFNPLTSIQVYDPFPPIDSIEAYSLIPDGNTTSPFALVRDATSQTPATDVLPTVATNNQAPFDLQELGRLLRGFTVSLIPSNPLTDSLLPTSPAPSNNNTRFEDVSQVQLLSPDHQAQLGQVLEISSVLDENQINEETNPLLVIESEGYGRHQSSNDNTSNNQSNNNNGTGIEILQEGFERPAGRNGNNSTNTNNNNR